MKQALLAVCMLVVGATRAFAFVEWLPVREPVQAEIERLRASGLADTAFVFASRPLDRKGVAFVVARARRLHPDSTDPSLVRLERMFGRELVDLGFPAPAGYTAPLATFADEANGLRGRIVAYGDGTLEVDQDSTAFLDRSRFGGRLNLEKNALLLHLDAYAGRVARAREFSDQLITDTEFIAYSEDTYGSLASGGFDLTLGRTGFAWGPGAHGSLLWSQQADPITALTLGASLFGHVRATALLGDVDASAGERIAGHRLEWFPSPRLTVGLAEAARFHSTTWEPLYLVPLLPFTWVQRILNHDQVGRNESLNDVRNNVMGALDASWRAAPGATVYGEFLLDDQGLKVGGSPTRIGYQAGVLATRTTGLGQFTGRLEYARVHRYVYSVFYGENFIHHAKPIGYPEGPDSRTWFAEGRFSPTAAWEFSAAALSASHGEGFLGEFFDPDSGAASGTPLSGVVERARTLSAAARWWPRDGVDLGVEAARTWIANADHVDGLDARRWAIRVSARLHR